MTICVYECVGGWLPVNESYVESRVRKMTVRDADEDEVGSIRVALSNSVTPCPVCRPEQYDLWRGGHFAPNHSCAECRPKRGRQPTTSAVTRPAVAVGPEEQF